MYNRKGKQRSEKPGVKHSGVGRSGTALKRQGEFQRRDEQGERYKSERVNGRTTRPTAVPRGAAITKSGRVCVRLGRSASLYSEMQLCGWWRFSLFLVCKHADFTVQGNQNGRDHGEPHVELCGSSAGVSLSLSLSRALTEGCAASAPPQY